VSAQSFKPRGIDNVLQALLALADESAGMREESDEKNAVANLD